MISSLTDAQRAKFPHYIKKWTDVGLCTSPSNRPKAQDGIVWAYKIAGLDAPKIVWCGSPLSQGLTRAICFDKAVWDSVGDSVGDSGYGQHDAGWIGFYDYFLSELGLAEQTQKLIGLTLITENAGWFLPHKNLCWVAERHSVLNRNEQGQLHKDGGEALSYPDGFSIYALNGVRMKKCQVMTLAENITPEEVLSETNADIRRELIRKVGVERMLAKLPHKSMDRVGDYELLSVNLGNGATDARYLKMVNPSISCFHMEGVAPECDTVEKSLNWRNSQWFSTAEVLT